MAQYGKSTQSRYNFSTNQYRYLFDDKLLNRFYRTSTAQLVAKLPMNGISGLVFGGPKRNLLYAVAGSTIINVNTLQIEQRISRTSLLYKIVGAGGRGKQYKRANI